MNLYVFLTTNLYIFFPILLTNLNILNVICNFLIVDHDIGVVENVTIVLKLYKQNIRLAYKNLFFPVIVL